MEARIYKGIVFYKPEGDRTLRDHGKTNGAIKKGLLEKKPCEVCGIENDERRIRRNVIAHHENYSDYLNVRWLCWRHHKAVHNLFLYPKEETLIGFNKEKEK
jgi:hypothetical protein